MAALTTGLTADIFAFGIKMHCKDMKTRAIKGHEFGLKLNPAEREQLISSHFC
jgi:hypothetical protein